MLPFLFAWRYLRGSNKESTISIMVVLSFVGIFIGSCALALVAFVMEGFETTTYQKLQGIHSQIVMRSYDREALDAPLIKYVITKEFPEIEAVTPSAVQYALAQAVGDDQNYLLAIVRGIDPISEQQVSNLLSTIRENFPHATTLSEILTADAVMVGETFARSNKLIPGSTLRLLLPEAGGGRKKSIQFESQEVVVSGIFKTGIEELDTTMVFCSLATFEKLFPQAGISSMGIKLKPGVHEQTLLPKLRARFGISVLSWKELYPALVDAMILEKYAMFFVLALITLVASMSMISLLFMLITQKRADIALLKSMGLADSVIGQIFMIVGMLITFAGCTLGLVAAVLCAYLLDAYQLIPLPDVYYVSHLPATINVYTIFIVFVVVMLLGLLASWWSTSSTRTINISHVLRFEG